MDNLKQRIKQLEDCLLEMDEIYNLHSLKPISNGFLRSGDPFLISVATYNKMREDKIWIILVKYGIDENIRNAPNPRSKVNFLLTELKKIDAGEYCDSGILDEKQRNWILSIRKDALLELEDM